VDLGGSKKQGGVMKNGKIIRKVVHPHPGGGEGKSTNNTQEPSKTKHFNNAS